MSNSSGLTRDLFLECEWSCNILPDKRHSYISIMTSLQNHSKKILDQGKVEHSRALDVLARAASMMLDASSINEPLKAYFQDFQAGKRTALPEDFTEEELSFFEEIIDDVNEPWLRARLADMLWLLKKPRSPAYARSAIDSYIDHHIDEETWNLGSKGCWERAARLCMQIKDLDRLDTIKYKLFSAFSSEYPGAKFMQLWIADLLDRLKIDNDFKEEISSSLGLKADALKEECDFNSARDYYALASKKYKQCSDTNKWLQSLVAIAECYELEAKSRSGESSMVASMFYEHAIQAYRNIPSKHRKNYCIEDKIKEVREKISISGKASLDEMGVISAPGIDISEIVNNAVNHVSGKQSVEFALLYFTGLFKGPNYRELIESAQQSIQESPLISLIGSRHISHDGRLAAKIPAIDLGADKNDLANKSALNARVQQCFSTRVQLVVEGQILPALRQLLMEHRFEKELLVTACSYSAIVPQGRERILGHALWLGFEHDFGSAIYLLCPQVEHIVRSQLKETGAHTTNIDKEGIESENGLSTLIELPEALNMYGEDLTFEIKSVFADSLGFNLRNEVAHGLLDDKASASIQSVYAWWMVLRLVIRSITNGGT